MNNRKSIALCGRPKSGKTTVAEILRDYHGYTIIDDGSPLREAVPSLFAPWGVLPADPHTQEGKCKEVEVMGTKVPVRQLLGDLGSYLESTFGEQFLAQHAVLRAEQHTAADVPCVFPSVRKSQGLSYKRAGIWVAEVDRNVPESPYEFDKWESGFVSLVIGNYGTLSDLRKGVQALVKKLNQGTL